VLTKTTSIVALAASLLLGDAGAARAQAAAQTVDPQAYGELNIAGQMQSVTVSSSSTFSLFGETGGTNFSHTVGNGLVFDGSGGYFIRKNLAVGASVSMFTRAPAGTVSISTPDPIAFNSFTVTSAEPKLKHTELGMHIKLSYRVPITDTIDVTVYGGPSFIRLTKEIATASVVNGAAQIATVSQSGTGIGAHGGVDLAYLFTRQVGGGIFVRYVGATVNLPAASVNVGGLQAGLGLRLRF
jgi:hypothetical protein